MEIFEKRGRFCFYEGAVLRKFATKEEAVKAGGEEPQVQVSGVPYKVDVLSITGGDED